MRRQPAGDTKGNNPSNTSTNARASHNESDMATPGPHLPAGATELLRIERKKSDEGSTTITSVLLAKLAL